MSNSEIIPELIATEISLSSTPFSAYRCYSLKIPAIKSLVNAAQTEKIVGVANWVLVDVFAHNVKHS